MIDHHATSVRPTQARLIHDAGKSASLLAYELCREAGWRLPPWIALFISPTWVTCGRVGIREFGLAVDYAGLVKEYGFWNLHRLIGVIRNACWIIRCLKSCR